MSAFDIVHVLAPSRAGGLERVVEMLAVGQAARGHRVSALAILSGGEEAPPLVERLTQGGVPVTVLRPGLRAYRAERSGVRDALATRARGIVHTHGYRGDVLHAPVAAHLGFATVTTLHGFTGGGYKNRLYEYVQRRSCRRFDRVVAVSRPIADLMKRVGVDARRLRVIPNAYVDAGAVIPTSQARARLGVDGERVVLGWVGRLSMEKGADVLLQALATVKDLPVVAAVIGEGAESTALRAMAHSLGVEHMVKWLGPIDGASSLFRGFDMLVLSSRTEGTPIVVFEAMAAGVPIVTTAVGGIPDVLTPAEAILVPSEAPAALGAAIRDVVANPERARARAVHASRVLEERFAPGPWLDRYDGVYDEAVRGKAGSTGD